MKAPVRAIALVLATSFTAACGSQSVTRPRFGQRPLRPTIEVLARSVSFDAPTEEDVARGGTVDVTVDLVGERLMDYDREAPAGSKPAADPVPGNVPASAYFQPPQGHSCCWLPADLAIAAAGSDGTPAPVDPASKFVRLPATVDDEPPAGLDASSTFQTGAAPTSIALPFDRTSLPVADIAKLERAGLTSGMPAVATIDVGDPAAPVVVALRVADARERASDPADPPTTALLPDALPIVPDGRCPRKTGPLPEHFVHTLRALGPVFFHQPIATPRTVPKGDVSFAWSVIGADRVRAMIVTTSRGCEQTALVDIAPSSEMALGPEWVERASHFGSIYAGPSPRREILIFGKLAYDVKGSTEYITRTVMNGFTSEAGDVERATI